MTHPLLLIAYPLSLIFERQRENKVLELKAKGSYSLLLITYQNVKLILIFSILVLSYN